MGSETELQAVVIGSRTEVDLPSSLAKHYGIETPDTAGAKYLDPKQVEIGDYLQSNQAGVWENSLVRIPRHLLSDRTWRIFLGDLLADKRDPLGGNRQDAKSFIRATEFGEQLRVPVSYLLRLGLTEALADAPGQVREPGLRWLGNFLNDNTSPETVSFQVQRPSRANGLGRVVAREKGARLLLTQLIVRYTNRRYRLFENGQEVQVYLAPNPPVRQRKLAQLIPSDLYRELYVNPCLAGWDEGEKKRDYMHLCHQVLSQSRSTAISVLRRNGITTGASIEPHTPDVSLSNNGIHVSIGSRSLTAARQSGIITAGEEKRLGDLTSKFYEHFLPLFTGLLSAAPYRFARRAASAEQLLGFLPHQLTPEHLQVLWAEWSGVLTQPKPGSVIAGGASDCPKDGSFGVTDLRLLDFLVAPLSIDQLPSLDGRPGNDERLKLELEQRGIFHRNMSLYTLYRLREYNRIGYSGFEARYYSLFEDIEADFAPAVDLQILITALATRLQLNGELSHPDIPDTCRVESERRQLLFSTAIGLPWLLVEEGTANMVLRSILRHSRGLRPSRRHPGYVELRRQDFQLALINFLRQRGADLIEMFGLETMMADLEQRIEGGGRNSVEARLYDGITSGRGTKLSDSPDGADGFNAESFNLAAERYYREDLSRRHLATAFDQLITDLCSHAGSAVTAPLELIRSIVPADSDLREWLIARRRDLLADRLDEKDLQRLIQLTVLAIDGAVDRADGNSSLAERALHAF